MGKHLCRLRYGCMRSNATAPSFSACTLTASPQGHSCNAPATLLQHSCNASHSCGNASHVLQGSGSVSFDEWRRVIRSRLKVSLATLQEDTLKALWCAIDSDDSNSVQLDEVARFLKGHVTEVQ